MSQSPPVGQLSPDGAYRWDGAQWVANTHGTPPPPPKKKGKAGKIALFGCGGVAAVLVLMIVVIVASNSGGKTTSQPAQADNSGPSGTSAPAVKANQARAPQTLLDLQGSGTKTTQKFTAPGDWDLAWSYDCSSFGNQGNFIVTIYSGDGSPSFEDQGVNQLGAKGSDVEHFHKGGTLYLEINSECSWSVKATG